jgi:L-fuconate dehydratase
MFKQLLQAEALDVVQLDGCRLGGVNEVIAVLLLAARFGVPVCPHAGGIGLCEHVQHFSMFDYVAESGRLDDRMVEYADHLHEHMVQRLDVRDGRYRAPAGPGMGIELEPASLERFRFPDGGHWAGVR